ncbi:MAG: hypothetical protein COB35_04930 [Gammaproteobacteria bacterium]|nr:MAG: hypothetical protein COB35_04930 [Gammaproteobacteria bacterium]
MKKLILSAVLALTVFSAVSATVANEKQVAIQQLQRAKIVNMVVELKLPDGSHITVNNMDFCTPGGFYNGVQALVFGDEAVKVMQAGMAALYPKVGDSINRMWNTKSNPDDPRLPTYLMIREPVNSKHNKKVKGDANKQLIGRFKSSAKILKIDDNTPIIMSTCGGYNHPDDNVR